MLTARVPDNSRTSTVSRRGVLDISSNFFLMNSFSAALWKYLDLAILSTNLKIFLPVFPPPTLLKKDQRRRECASLRLAADLVLQILKSKESHGSGGKMKSGTIWSVMSAQLNSLLLVNEHSQTRRVEKTTCWKITRQLLYIFQ